jgi:glutathione S-transferase
MKLYFAPGACSLNPHIVFREAGLNVELERVDLRTHKTEKGEDFYAINPKGYVPALRLDDGQLLTENPAIAQYLAELKPEKNLIPKVGTLERYRVLEALGFIATELHKTYGALFNPSITPEAKAQTLEKLGKRWDLVEKDLAGREYAAGAQFSVADAYLFVMLQWAANMGPDMASRPNLKKYQERIAARPAVKAALEAEAAAKAGNTKAQ